ncbi:UBP-type zinc finger domain-containing protein [Amycolatopsis sp. H20-H5]|uniref:UBP-type zinc finger domain-containing protein n=1 Tax=Amycolatopsis sp. H20-H5 TaxID=3046309 RepID=UPI002DBFC5B8|nr:UBP-type zinc finger domain-containing protein [Amycolatopsis sp. H20-H5]MEC3976052.1 UBP-type zinc finger domain-containing protein [Amycolatopsis sp. H20-H5]
MSTERIPGINPTAKPSGNGCAGCSTGDGPGWWFHLRRCAECGEIGCCDSSPAQHASKHASEAGHPFLTSFEPGEDWFWDTRTEEFYDGGPELAAPAAHPAEQPTPGPEDAVPADWQQLLH